MEQSQHAQAAASWGLRATSCPPQPAAAARREDVLEPVFAKEVAEEARRATKASGKDAPPAIDTLAPGAGNVAMGSAQVSRPGEGRPWPLHMDELADAFLAEACVDDPGAPAAPWGGKLGHSIFDEEEVMGPYVELDLVEFYDDGEDDDQYEDGDDELYSDGMWEDEDDAPPSPAAFFETGELPRAAKLIRPLCCLYAPGHDLPDRCPICLDGVQAGQAAWRLPCTHALHGVCAIRYFGSRRSRAVCPVCRSDLKRVATASAGQVL